MSKTVTITLALGVTDGTQQTVAIAPEDYEFEVDQYQTVSLDLAPAAGVVLDVSTGFIANWTSIQGFALDIEAGYVEVTSTSTGAEPIQVSSKGFFAGTEMTYLEIANTSSVVVTGTLTVWGRTS